MSDLTIETMTADDVRALRESPVASKETRELCTKALMSGSRWARATVLDVINVGRAVDRIFGGAA